MFDKKGQILVPAASMDEETAMTAAIEAGADDFSVQDDIYEIFTSPESFHAVLEELKNRGLEPESAELSMVPQNYIKLEGKTVRQMVKLMDLLDDNEDVQNVYANCDFEESELADVV